eukprot:CAMPEP_0170313460 /NCGR_PEP_ID=MMETSP0116_2-20130129/57280_1 /TAXON_ID=400756 /ORGANISM="Durinskia baltica, Strain CSIRO CS-38" /LENGTH=148 /DNA_ID=CAMNT_0010565863 /DNA_START=170 /DNA_END=613 /DNA_ORIENTATION=-
MELRASPPFYVSVEHALGDSAAALELVSEGTVIAIAGRLLMNTIGFTVSGAAPGGAPLRGAGLFLLLSMMNHSCAPSAEPIFSSSTEVSLRTLRGVAEGEELSLAYVQPELPLAERREQLLHWFFECNCRVCETEARVSSVLGIAAVA